MILSFGWTWPAFVAGEKTVTRRDWKPVYSTRWRQGMTFKAYNRSPRFGGVQIGAGRLTYDAMFQPLIMMPDEDYLREGFVWLKAHPQALPKSARKQCWGNCTWDSVLDWRNSGGLLYVVRFEITKILDTAKADLAKLLEAAS